MSLLDMMTYGENLKKVDVRTTKNRKSSAETFTNTAYIRIQFFYDKLLNQTHGYNILLNKYCRDELKINLGI